MSATVVRILQGAVRFRRVPGAVVTCQTSSRFRGLARRRNAGGFGDAGCGSIPRRVAFRRRASEAPMVKVMPAVKFNSIRVLTSPSTRPAKTQAR